MMTKEELIQFFSLEPLPGEGGFFKQSFVSSIDVSFSINSTESKKRKAGSAIFYLLDDENFSAFHRVAQDEVFHFYYGSPVELFVLHSSRGLQSEVLGTDFKSGMVPQAHIPAGKWQASRILGGQGFALIGATVSPAFEFEDLTVANCDTLSQEFPNFKTLIEELTR